MNPQKSNLQSSSNYLTESPRIATALMNAGFPGVLIQNPHSENNPLWTFERTELLMWSVRALQGCRSAFTKVEHNEENKDD